MKAGFVADLHVHTTYSDGIHSVAEIVDLYGLQGFGAIAITDHICEEQSWMGRAALRLNKTLTPSTFSSYLGEIEAEAERAWERYRMVVIPGYELSKNSLLNSRSAHILGLGIRKFSWADAPTRDLCRTIHEDGGIAIAAHPVWTRKFEMQTYHLWDNREELAPEFDAWEVASGPHLFPEVQRSGLPVVASGDLHHRRQMTSWKTVLSCNRDVSSILDAVRRQLLTVKFYREVLTYDYGKYLERMANHVLKDSEHNPISRRAGNESCL